MTEEIAFSDWSKRLECSSNTNAVSEETGSEPATNSWLPAYGFHQPSAAVQQAFLQNKNIEFYSSDVIDGVCRTHLLLETIIEETSDDLRSETSESEYNSGLLTDSVSTVIHIPTYKKNHQSKKNWNEKKCSMVNTDPGVQDDDDDDDDDDEDDFTDEDDENNLNDTGDDDDNDDDNDDDEDDSEEDLNANRLGSEISSRTNSLLQFENLEKHYENIFRSQRTTSEPYELPNPYLSGTSSRRWPFKSSSHPENLNNLRDIDDDNNDSSSLSSTCTSSSSSSDLISSDEMLCSSYSSTRYNSFSRKLSLRSFRSVDSLTSLHHKQEKDHDLLHCIELSQSLADNISKVNELESVDEITTPARGLYKTMECLSEIADREMTDNVGCGNREENIEKEAVKSRRSTENLSEDSGFGDHIVKECDVNVVNASATMSLDAIDMQNEMRDCVGEISQHCTAERTTVLDEKKDEGEAPAKFSTNSWQSDSDLLNRTYVIEANNYRNVVAVDCCVRNNKLEDSSSSVAMASRLSVVSTPNLYQEADEEYHYRGKEMTNAACLSAGNDSTVSLSRVYSLKRINLDGENILSEGASSSKGSSNFQISTSFVNLTSANSGSNKGVHFCPVVSEVSWQDSYSSNEECSDAGGGNSDSVSSDEERESRYSRLLTSNAIQENGSHHEPTPSMDELVERLLSDSSTKCSVYDHERTQREQRVRLDLITSPPPEYVRENSGGGGGGIAHVTATNMPSPWVELTSSTAAATSHCSPSHCSSTIVNASIMNSSSSSSTRAANESNATITFATDSDGNISARKEKSKSSVGKIGGFFQRFSLKRLSGRKNKNKKLSSSQSTVAALPVVVGCVPKNSNFVPNSNNNNNKDDAVRNEDGSYDTNYSRIERDAKKDTSSNETVYTKPPLPPFAPARRRLSTSDGSGNGVGGGGGGGGIDPAPPRSLQYLSALEQQQYSQQRDGDSNTPMMLRKTPYIDPNTGVGLLETDIDSNLTLSSITVNNNNNTSPGNKKSRSLLNLDNGRMSAAKQLMPMERTKTTSPHHSCNDYRAKSMEFLLDKENQVAVKAPENELQKSSGERKVSEHELRVQKSLQKLNVPDWYKNSSVPSQGFLLKRHSDAGHHVQSQQRWNTNSLPSKTTSLSSLGSNLSNMPRSPTCTVTSPGPSHYSFSRWSTSRLNSGTNSSNTSPSGSARSSFNYRQPYLGWRSQEKLSKPRTPAERLAAGLLPQNNQNGSQQSSPSLTEVRSSIKEVTSAIVHYVSGTRDSSDRLSPSLRYNTDSSSRSTSPRGSTGRLCWLESSFVGSRPSNAPPETPSLVTENKIPQVQRPDKMTNNEMYSSYSANNSQKCCENQTYNNRLNGEYLLA